MRSFRSLAATLFLFVGVLAGCDAFTADAPGGDAAQDGTEQQRTPRAERGDERGFLDGVDDLVDEVRPSVVSVLAGPQAGAGVIYDADGLIVTNDHVISRAGADPIVVFADGTRATATVRGTAPSSDLALLEVPRDDLPAIDFDTDLPDVGAIAIAVGNPLGLESTVTAGIVSGLGRELPTGEQNLLVDLIQTDAAISPGNSGGLLVSGDGRAIGITVAYIPPQTGAVSIGFAIPSYVVVDVVADLLEQGEVDTPFLGVAAHSLSPQTAERFELEVSEGAVITEVAPGSPAAEVGIEPGDIVTAVGEHQVEDLGGLLAAVRRFDPGDTVTVSLFRDGESREVEVRIGNRDSEQA